MRVLVVEDEVIVAMALEDMLLELGHHVVGPASDLDEARALAESGGFEVALIDVNLNGERSYEVARLLREKGVAFAFLTGYGAAALGEGGVEAPVLTKPYRAEGLAQLLDELAGA